MNQIFKTDLKMVLRTHSQNQATIGSKSKGFEYLFELDYRRQQKRIPKSRPLP